MDSSLTESSAFGQDCSTSFHRNSLGSAAAVANQMNVRRNSRSIRTPPFSLQPPRQSDQSAAPQPPMQHRPTMLDTKTLSLKLSLTPAMLPVILFPPISPSCSSRSSNSLQSTDLKTTRQVTVSAAGNALFLQMPRTQTPQMTSRQVPATRRQPKMRSLQKYLSQQRESSKTSLSTIPQSNSNSSSFGLDMKSATDKLQHGLFTEAVVAMSEKLGEGTERDCEDCKEQEVQEAQKSTCNPLPADQGSLTVASARSLTAELQSLNDEDKPNFTEDSFQAPAPMLNTFVSERLPPLPKPAQVEVSKEDSFFAKRAGAAQKVFATCQKLGATSPLGGRASAFSSFQHKLKPTRSRLEEKRGVTTTTTTAQRTSATGRSWWSLRKLW